MEIKIKRLDEKARIPAYAKPGDAGLDLYATSCDCDNNGNIVYGTGIAIELPEGYAALVLPRSSIANKDLILSNSVGLIDSGYRGEISAKFKRAVKCSNGVRLEYDDFRPQIYEVGERVAQLVIIPYPHIEFIEVDELSQSERGCGGYGSTGK